MSVEELNRLQQEDPTLEVWRGFLSWWVAVLRVDTKDREQWPDPYWAIGIAIRLPRCTDESGSQYSCGRTSGKSKDHKPCVAEVLLANCALGHSRVLQIVCCMPKVPKSSSAKGPIDSLTYHVHTIRLRCHGHCWPITPEQDWESIHPSHVCMIMGQDTQRLSHRRI